jgi:Mrp family chromosome partitioning ATPase
MTGVGNQIATRASGSPVLHIQLPGLVWDLERRNQFRHELEQWRAVSHSVILVDLPPASVPEAVLLAENLPQLIWLVDAGKSHARDTRLHLETLRHARCKLVGAVLNHELEPLIKL